MWTSISWKVALPGRTGSMQGAVHGSRTCRAWSTVCIGDLTINDFAHRTELSLKAFFNNFGPAPGVLGSEVQVFQILRSRSSCCVRLSFHVLNERANTHVSCAFGEVVVFGSQIRSFVPFALRFAITSTSVSILAYIHQLLYKKG